MKKWAPALILLASLNATAHDNYDSVATSHMTDTQVCYYDCERVYNACLVYGGNMSTHNNCLAKEQQCIADDGCETNNPITSTIEEKGKWFTELFK